MIVHDLKCALRPGSCEHDPQTITHCVICGRWLHNSPHMDTCGESCFNSLMRQQRALRAQDDQ